MKERLNNKKASSISVTLLVFLTLILCITSLFIFANSENKFSEKTEMLNEMNKFYSENQIFEFYLNNIARKVIMDNPNINNNEEMISKFKAEYFAQSTNAFFSDEKYIEYREQIINANYEVVFGGQDSNKFVIFNIKNFTFKKAPGLSTSQEIGYIECKRDMVFKIYF